MTNAALQAFIQEFGDKIFLIVLDNNHKVFMTTNATSEGNENDATTIEMKTFGDVDMFRVKHTDRTWHNGQRPEGIKYSGWMVTGCIQSIYTTDDEEYYVPDLNKFF